MTELEKIQKEHREAADIFQASFGLEDASYYNGLSQGLWKAIRILQVNRIIEKENKVVFPEKVENLIKEHKRRVFQARREMQLSIIEGLKMSAAMKIIRDSNNATDTQKVEAIWEIIMF